MEGQHFGAGPALPTRPPLFFAFAAENPSACAKKRGDMQRKLLQPKRASEEGAAWAAKDRSHAATVEEDGLTELLCLTAISAAGSSGGPG